MDYGLEGKVKNSEKEEFRSEGERKVAGVLDKYGVKYIHEQGVLVTPEKNKPRVWYPDFFLPEFSVYIEYYGLAGNPEYDQCIRKKISVYSAMQMNVIPVYPRTLSKNLGGYIMRSIDQILTSRRQKFMEKGYRNSVRPVFGRSSSYGKKY